MKNIALIILILLILANILAIHESVYIIQNNGKDYPFGAENAINIGGEKYSSKEAYLKNLIIQISIYSLFSMLTGWYIVKKYISNRVSEDRSLS